MKCRSVFIGEKSEKIDKFHLLISILITFFYIGFKVNGIENISNIIFFILCVHSLVSNTNQLSYLWFFFTPLFLYVTFNTFPIYNIIIILLVLRKIIFEKKGIPILLLCFICYFIIIELIGLIRIGDPISFNFIKFFLLILLLGIHLVKPLGDFKLKIACKYLIWGTTIYDFYFIITNFNTVITDSTRPGGLGELDPNTYGMYNIFTIGVLLINLSDKSMNKSQKILYSLLGILICISGFLTLSKTYFLMTILICLLYILFSKFNIKKFFIYIVSGGIIFTFVRTNLFLNNIFNLIIDRFASTNNLSELTTGRSDIYREYIKLLSEKTSVIIFGAGMYSYLDVLKINRPHNSTLELLTSWGIIGSIIFILYLFYCGRSYGKNVYSNRKKSIQNYIPLIMLLIYSQSLTIFYQEATYAYLLLGIMVIFIQND